MTNLSPSASRWYVPTPAKFLVAVLVMQGVLFLSAHFHWFWFNERKGHTVLITFAATVIAFIVYAAMVSVGWLFKRRVQFSLATLLLMVPVLGIPCAWLAQTMHDANREQRAVKWLQSLGGAWYYRTHAMKGNYSIDGRLQMQTSFAMSLPGDHHNEPRWLRNWLGAEFFDRPTRDVRLGDRFPDERNYFQPGLHADEKFDITDDEIYRLREFNELEYLEISSRKLTDEGLRSLHGLRRLRRLALVAPHVSPAGIAELRRQLPECRITFSDDIEDRSVPTRGSDG